MYENSVDGLMRIVGGSSDLSGAIWKDSALQDLKALSAEHAKCVAEKAALKKEKVRLGLVEIPCASVSMRGHA